MMKKRIVLTLVLVLFLPLAWLIYNHFGHQLITAMYEGTSIALLNRVIVGQANFTLEYYLHLFDRLFIRLLLGTIIFLIAAINLRSSQLAFLYSFISHISDICLKHKKLSLLLGSLIILAVLAYTAFFILQDFPNSADEYCFIYQAKTYLAGRLWNQPHPLQEFFDFTWITSRGEKVFSMYFPGWPLVLTAALALKLPLWLVNPILAVLSLWVIFLLGRRLYNERVAVLSTIVVALCAFFLFNSASYFAHTLCSLLILVFVYNSLCFIYNQKAYHALLAGIFLGGALITRPYSAFLSALPIFIYLLLNRPKPILKLGWFFVGVMPFFLALLLYNFKITGHALVTPQSLVIDSKYWGFNLEGIKTTFWFLRNFMLWTPTFILIIYLIYLPHIFKQLKNNLIALIFPAIVIGHFFFLMHGGNQYGPRYYYSAFPFVILFAVSQLFQEDSYVQKSNKGKFLFFLFIVSLCINIPFLIDHFREERQVIWERKEPYRLVEQNKISNALIFLSTGSSSLREITIQSLTRNGVDYSGSVLYVRDLGKKNQHLMSYYPQRNYYLYYHDRKTNRGHLEPLYKLVPGTWKAHTSTRCLAPIFASNKLVPGTTKAITSNRCLAPIY